jgi:CheY-like chemotaxis protein
MTSFFIALVEDNDDHAFIVERCLRKADCDLKIVRHCNAEMAMASFKDEDEQSKLPDLILMDINMPGMDGIEATRQIKATNRMSRIPVVILSTSSGMIDYLRALDNHANSYAVKSPSYSELAASLSKIVTYWKDVHLNASQIQ